MENKLWELLIWLEENADECKRYEEKQYEKRNYFDAYELGLKSKNYSEIACKLKEILKSKDKTEQSEVNNT